VNHRAEPLKNSGKAQSIRFGPFLADLDSQELFKNKIRLKIPGQSFRVLALLLGKPGVLVTREELQQSMWPSDTFVDFDHGLSAAVNRLRDALGDSADNPRYIETLPRRGYRFIGEIGPADQGNTGNDVEGGVEELTAADASDASNGVGHARRSKKTMVVGVVVVGAVLVVVLGFVFLRSKPQASSKASVPIPFSTLPGSDTAPAFSPDGSRIAFAWNGNPQSRSAGYDVYVKALGSETLLQLTHHPSEWISSAWSPDGTQIAIHRMAGSESGIYLIPALGGAERLLVRTHPPYFPTTRIDWSPDGKWIAFDDQLPTERFDRMFRVSLETLEVQPLPHNPACMHEGFPHFSHGGRTLFYSCIHGLHAMEINSVPVAGGASTILTSVSNNISGFAISGDDSRLVFAYGFGGMKMAVINLRDRSVRDIETPDQPAWPTISPQNDKIAYSSGSAIYNIWRRDLLHPEAPPVKVITSTRQQNSPQYSPDGKHIAFESTRGGSWSVWMSDGDGANPVKLSKDLTTTGAPRWSPDGKRIAFDTAGTNPSSVYIVDVTEGVPRKLKTDVEDMKLPTWSHDGTWIYFTSDVELGHKIYRCSVKGGAAEELPTHEHTLRPAESADGAYLYFASREVNFQLQKISLADPKPGIQTEATPRILQWTLWQLVPGGFYFVPNDAPRTMRYFDLASHKAKDVFTLEKDFDDGISVSPDGRYILYSQADEQSEEIMLMDRY